MNNNPFEKGETNNSNPFESSGKKNNTSQKNNTYNKEYSSKMEKNISSIKEENIKKIKKENVNNHSLKNKNSQIKKRRKLIIIVGIIIAIIFLLYYVWPPQIEESIKDGKEVYTIKNVGGKRAGDYDYWTFTVGEDIPAGIYSTNVLNNVFIHFESLEYNEKFETSISLGSFYAEDQYFDTLPLVDGMEIIVRSYANIKQDVEFIKEDKQGELDLNDHEKLGVYKINKEKLKVPVEFRGLSNEAKLFNNIEVYTFSEDELIKYNCSYESCTIRTYPDEKYNREEVELSELIKDDNDFFTLDLLDETYVQVLD